MTTPTSGVCPGTPPRFPTGSDAAATGRDFQPQAYGDGFVLTLFTNDSELARRADQAGVNRVGLDLERIGKAERQDRRKCWISGHQVHELSGIASVLTTARLFARTNPIHADSAREIEELLALGVKTLMLPMFRSAAEAGRFSGIIAGRAEVSLLVETADAVANIREIVKVPGIDEIHVGLNDLHLELRMRSHFEVLVSPLMRQVSQCVRAAGIGFGFGGIGRVEDASLPVPSELIYAQYPFYQADRALVSRVFLAPDHRVLDLAAEVAAFRRSMSFWAEQTEEHLWRRHRELQRRVAALDQSLRRSG
jgi:hypothetical protein